MHCPVWLYRWYPWTEPAVGTRTRRGELDEGGASDSSAGVGRSELEQVVRRNSILLRHLRRRLARSEFSLRLVTQSVPTSQRLVLEHHSLAARCQAAHEPHERPVLTTSRARRLDDSTSSPRWTSS